MREFVKQYWPALIAAAGVILIFLMIVGFQEYRVRQTAEASHQAELRAEAEAARAEEAEKRVSEITAETTRQLQEAQSIIAQMRASLDASRASERAALASRDVLLRQRDRDIAGVATETDTALAQSTESLARDVYPDLPAQVLATSTGFHIDRIGAEVFKTALIETQSRRQQENADREIAEQRLEQIHALEAILAQKDNSLEAINRRLSSMEDQILSLQNSNVAYKSQVDALQSELAARKRKNFWSRWGNRSLSVAALISGVLIGRSL